MIGDIFASLDNTFDYMEVLTQGMKPDTKCYSHAQLVDDRERVKRLRRQQFKKGGRK